MSGMPTTATRHYMLTLDGHSPVAVESVVFELPPTTRVYSEHATKPDSGWRHTDAHGHLHRWVGDDLPTLTPTQRHVECDWSCDGACEGEGYFVTVWHCANCGDEVTPGRVRDHGGTEIVTGPATATVSVAGRPLDFDSEPLAGVLTSEGEAVNVRAWLHEVRKTMDAPPSSTLLLSLEPTP